MVNRTGLSKTTAEIAVETVFETMKRSMERGERIELRGFGVFNIRRRKTGIGRNPNAPVGSAVALDVVVDGVPSQTSRIAVR